MIAPAEPLEPFESEEEKVAYCRQFLEQRGYGVSEPLPALNLCAQARSWAYVLDTAKRPSEGQMQAIQAALALAGSSVPELATWYIDEGSDAKKRLVDRTQGRQLRYALKRGDHIWIAHWDRLGKDDLDCALAIEQLVGCGVILHVLDFLGGQLSLTSTADLALLTVWKESIKARRQHVSERTKLGMANAKAAGRVSNGVAPIGYRKVGQGKKSSFKADWNDQRICNVVWRLYHERHWSIYRICKELRAQRVLIPPGHSQGRGWCDERIKKVIAHKELLFPNCPEGTTKIDDLLDSSPAQSPNGNHAAANQKQQQCARLGDGRQ